MQRLLPVLLVALLLPFAAAQATVTVTASPDRTSFAPVVAALPDGGWAVAWEAIAPGTLGQIRLRVLDATGAPRGAEQVVDTGILALAMRAPRLAVSPGGEILVAYRLQRYNYSGLAVRRFAAHGEPLDGGGRVVIFAGPTEIGRHDAAALPAGGWLVAYGFTPFDGSAPAAIRALKLDATGAPTGPAGLLSTADGASRFDPALMRRPSGLLAAWVVSPPTGAEPATPPVVVGHRLDPHGDPSEIEVPLRLEDGTPKVDRLPAVASAGDAEGRAVWLAVDETARTATLRTRRLLDGTPLGNMIDLRIPVAGVDRTLPALATDQRGRFLVAWAEPIAGDPEGRWQAVWQAFGRSATPLGATVGLPAITGPGSSSPGVAMQPSGSWAVVWGAQAPGGESTIYADLGALVNDCEAGETALCLTGGRFRVEAFWEDPTGRRGVGHALPMTGETGAFWFFEPGNVELVVKVLNACALADFRDFWVFASGLTDVAVELVVNDTATGERWSYDNPRGVPFPPVQDTGALRVCP